MNSLSKIFLKLFPLPKFLAAPSFGLDISDESVKYAELLKTKEGIRIGRYGERSIPAGVIESGRIKDSKRMEEILASLRKEVGIRSVHVSLPEEQVYLFPLCLGKIGLKNIREGIELALEDHIPIPAPEAIFDYELVSESPEALELQVTAIPRNIIENYLLIFKNSEIRVQSFEVEAQSISRAVIKKDDKETYMIVDFGKKRTGICIVSGGIVMFTFTLDFGGVTLTNALQKGLNLSFEEADKIKQQQGLEHGGEEKEIFNIILNSISVLRDEVIKHFLYWHTHKDEERKSNPPIKKIIFCGGESNLIGLPDYIASSIKIGAENADVLINIKNTENYIPEMSFRQTLAFATAVGLALRDFNNE